MVSFHFFGRLRHLLRRLFFPRRLREEMVHSYPGCTPSHAACAGCTLKEWREIFVFSESPTLQPLQHRAILGLQRFESREQLIERLLQHSLIHRANLQSHWVGCLNCAFMDTAGTIE